MNRNDRIAWSGKKTYILTLYRPLSVATKAERPRTRGRR